MRTSYSDSNSIHYELITRSRARGEYLLADHDLDERRPLLKCIKRKNPHNPRWGDMKLYLKWQVEARAIDIHGSLANVKEKMDEREEKRLDVVTKKREKQLTRWFRTTSRRRELIYRTPQDHPRTADPGRQSSDEASARIRRRAIRQEDRPPLSIVSHVRVRELL